MKPTSLAVLVRRIPDPQRIQVDRKQGKLITADIPYILNPVDLSAIELGLRLKETTGASLAAVTIDEPAAEFELREALALGCDRALLVSDPAFEGADTLSQARIFQRVIERVLKPQVVLAASRSIDHNWSTVGPQLAYLLGWSFLIEAETLDVRDGGVRALAHTGALRAVQETSLPFIATVARGAVKPRSPTAPGIAAAFETKRVETLSAKDLELGEADLKALRSHTRVLRVHSQEVPRQKRRIEGEAEEVGRLLARRLVDQGWAGRRP